MNHELLSPLLKIKQEFFGMGFNQLLKSPQRHPLANRVSRSFKCQGQRGRHNTPDRDRAEHLSSTRPNSNFFSREFFPFKSLLFYFFFWLIFFKYKNNIPKFMGYLSYNSQIKEFPIFLFTLTRWKFKT